jgi:hypothetical protein
MADITNQQLLDSINEKFATKDDLQGFATKDDLKAGLDDLKSSLYGLEVRIKKRIASASEVSTAHHLETRAQVGDQVTKLEKIREGLASAGSF